MVDVVVVFVVVGEATRVQERPSSAQRHEVRPTSCTCLSLRITIYCVVHDGDVYTHWSRARVSASTGAQTLTHTDTCARRTHAQSGGDRDEAAGGAGGRTVGQTDRRRAPRRGHECARHAGHAYDSRRKEREGERRERDAPAEGSERRLLSLSLPLSRARALRLRQSLLRGNRETRATDRRTDVLE